MLDNKTRLQRCINLIRFSCAIAIVICVYFYFMCTDYFTFFVRHFYHQDAKYDIFLSPKINKFSTRLIFARLYSSVVKIWFIRARKVLEEFEGEYDFWLKTNSSIFCQNSNKEKQNKLPLGMMNALGTMLFEATFGIRVRLSWRQNEIFPLYPRYFITIQTTLLLVQMIKYSYSLYSVDTKSSNQMVRIAQSISMRV